MRWTAALLWMILAPAGVASAQWTQGVETPPGEISVGISLQTPPDVNVRPLCERLSLACSSPKTVPDIGWVISGARNFTTSFAIVGEIGTYNNVWDSWETIRSNHREANHVHGAMAGPRISTRFLHFADGTDLRFFGQALAGVQVSDIVPGGRAVRAGAGADFATRSGVMVRQTLDYCFARDQPRRLSGGRWLIAIVFPVGSRD
jgi:hypothetical protein